MQIGKLFLYKNNEKNKKNREKIQMFFFQFFFAVFWIFDSKTHKKRNLTGVKLKLLVQLTAI